MTPADVAIAYLAALDDHDVGRLESLLAEAVRHEHNTAMGSDCVGRDEYLRRLPHFVGAFTDRHYRVDDLVSEDRDAVADVVVRYRFRAQYHGAPIEFPGVMWLTIRDEQITRRIDTFDSMLFLRQTGRAAPGPPAQI